MLQTTVATTKKFQKNLIFWPEILNVSWPLVYLKIFSSITELWYLKFLNVAFIGFIIKTVQFFVVCMWCYTKTTVALKRSVRHLAVVPENMHVEAAEKKLEKLKKIV